VEESRERHSRQSCILVKWLWSSPLPLKDFCMVHKCSESLYMYRTNSKSLCIQCCESEKCRSPAANLSPYWDIVTSPPAEIDNQIHSVITQVVPRLKPIVALRQRLP